MKFWRRKTILTSIEPLQLPPSGAGGRKQEAVVGLHLGTSYSSYAFARKSNPEVIITNYVSSSEPFRNAAILTAIYYKPEVGVENGDLHFRSWGYEARKEFTKDLAAVRKLRQQAATSVNVQSSGEMPVLGFYITPLKQHVSSSDAGPSSPSKLPPGLTLNRVISDYLRAMGKFILLQLQHYCFSYSLSMEDVQWSVARVRTGMGYIDVKVADFGLAKAKLMSSTAAKQTKDIGTTPYRAPELYTQEEEIAKKNYPPKADVYSYGITCAEILTGNIPFPHSKYRRADLLQIILKGDRPPLPDDCPTLLANLITRCWDTDPCNRPGFLQVCNELLDFKRSNMMI
ncbi:unnamed protein product [Sphagnum jensenii]|uniref:Protein kinase domain-containing protein n=1 Tax=Sphagnum jensenii TaxID=128206 RepID=A0ABP1AEF9_9BRYO